MDNTFTVQGMTCGHCEMAVKKAITRLDPEAKVTIDRAHNRVDVNSALSRETLANTIVEEGYTVA
jgi:copper chaperone